MFSVLRASTASRLAFSMPALNMARKAGVTSSLMRVVLSPVPTRNFMTTGLRLQPAAKKTTGRKTTKQTATKKPAKAATKKATKASTAAKKKTRKVAASKKKKPTRKAAKKKPKKRVVKKKVVKKPPVFKMPQDQLPPKSPASPLALYIQDRFAHQNLKGLHREQVLQKFSATTGEWNNLSSGEQQRYRDRYHALQDKYKTDYLAWWKKTDPTLIRKYNRLRRSKKKPAIKSPEGARAPVTPYIKFFLEHRDPSQDFKESARAAGAAWKALSAAEKQRYTTEYRAALAEHKKTLGL